MARYSITEKGLKTERCPAGALTLFQQVLRNIRQINTKEDFTLWLSDNSSYFVKFMGIDWELIGPLNRNVGEVITRLEEVEVLTGSRTESVPAWLYFVHQVVCYYALNKAGLYPMGLTQLLNFLVDKGYLQASD
ncbi:hypothetical protein A3K34_02080 [candidate division WWE3 bacterium RIFOXYC1_FULL_40_10]|uniref:Uncharacterized protein n=1 Tax=candidate division WWE3 bacterium RIFOXYA2_FULL_46_9 TaxID=1802636 RepID=A0A1F4VZR2_UNCKA|nr:MAG: hypothetical protein A3K58_02080 [candidate division WWE3 bacterium RIFOXYB1_FULL_40_22]OGC61643.1 MAG: hypothetical protein A3K37_02080 [candidate division WWE3 bacterium RIFOXYA1_FULL_40_11]OGC62652.1 MAG: hypothetical protein A2264_02135 [candidate division WWE3 bacterium RIFOXYA2_FULL_46_9]OGC64680.1 MAG: hypothetical protein A2326_01365 [candidate division WWE3 bacterium RIFOXYB2_FULL_41_6]OGC66026.1 MAG: hypothetical protein A3K34_02080 [candidate division WWE3 bacterium RIFOXYC1_